MRTEYCEDCRRLTAGACWRHAYTTTVYPENVTMTPLAADGWPIIYCRHCYAIHSQRWACDELLAAARIDGQVGGVR